MPVNAEPELFCLLVKHGKQCNLWYLKVSQYKYTITYVKGKDNMVADALSRLPDDTHASSTVSAIFTIENDPRLFSDV